MDIVEENIKYCVDPYIKSLSLFVEQGYEVHTCVGGLEKWSNELSEIYTPDVKQLIILGGDYEGRVDVLDDMPNIIVLRQSFIKSAKRKNEVLIPSSYGCVAGNVHMPPCPPTRIPRVSFCGALYTHASRKLIFDVLTQSDSIECNFKFTSSPCSGYADSGIEHKMVDFNETMETSEFVMCPRGNGNFSIRFYEALLSGRIPVIFDTDAELPFEKYVNWGEVCVMCKDEGDVVNKIVDFHATRDIIHIQKQCKQIFKQYFVDAYDVYLWKEVQSAIGV